MLVSSVINYSLKNRSFSGDYGHGSKVVNPLYCIKKPLMMQNKNTLKDNVSFKLYA